MLVSVSASPVQFLHQWDYVATKNLPWEYFKFAQLLREVLKLHQPSEHSVK